MEKKTSGPNKDLFERMPVPEAVRRMAVPTILGQMIVLIYSMADTFFIGRTNDPDMVAAASLILPVFNVTQSIASLCGTGGGSLISRLIGSGRADDAKRVYTFSSRFALAIAALFSLLTLLFMKPLLTFLGAEGAVTGFAKSYTLCVIVAGAVPTALSLYFSAVLRSVGESKKAAFGITLGGLINIALDPLFMFVLLPDGMEIIGAGVATCLSNVISCAYFIWAIRHLGEDSVLRTVRERASGELVRSVFRVGIPSSITNFLFDLDYIIIGRLMSAYGTVPLAAIGIVLKAERLPLNIGVGIAQGMMPIVAYNYAAKSYGRMEDTRRYALKLGIVLGLVSVALYEAFAPFIMRFFIADAATVTVGTDFLRIRALATVLMYMSFFHVFLFNGYGLGEKALFLGVIRWLGFNIPMLYLFNTLFGMYGLPWAQVAADILTVSVSFFVYARFKKKLLSGKGVGDAPQAE